MENEKLTKVVVGEIEKIESYKFYNLKELEEVVILDTVHTICENAFKNCQNLKRVFIPKSVKIIEKNAFTDCPKLEIYCEGEPEPNWVNKTEIEEVEERYISPEDDAFNFHRSSGSWSYSTYIRKVEVKVSWNPSEYKVHTNAHLDDLN